MTTAESVALARRAKEGDREAWDELCRRYYPRWLGRFHGRLGKTLRRLRDTDDVIQSALKDALQHVGQLRNDATFFSWVSTIIRRKIADAARGRGGRHSVALDEIRELPARSAEFGLEIETTDDYLRVLDSVLELFHAHAEHMAILSLRYLEDCEISDLVGVYGKSERTIHRRLENAVLLLQSKLGTT